MSDDRFLTLAGTSEAQVREKASRFIGFAFPVGTEEGMKDRLMGIAKAHHAARHHCYAYVIDGRERANDAGEPSGTAGRPILRQLQANGLNNAAIIVVRYFGGTLLGRGGLVRAYGDAAREAIGANTIIEAVRRVPVRIDMPYDRLEPMRQAVITAEGTIERTEYGAHCSMQAAVPSSRVDAFIQEHAAGTVRIVRLQLK
ncbi:MAG: YigZ family protein [Flavobacteriales bacterium]|nr:YigZ family protein [Flavobacteriales bacterium]MCB9168297.1 YigZ family protein [Flavobacteriales bacterium]